MTTPTPEAVRKAQHAMMWVNLPFGGNDLMISLDANAAHAAAKLAYEAMSPIIAAQAKAEALRELAESYMGEWPFMRKKWGGNDDTEANAAREIAMKTMRWLQQQAETAETATIESDVTP